MQFNEDFLPEVEGQIRRHVGDLASDEGQRDGTIGIHKDIEQGDDEQSAEQPAFGGATDTIHDVVAELFHILNAAFNGVLVLVVGLGLTVLYHVHPVNVLDGFAHFDFGIVAH